MDLTKGKEKARELFDKTRRRLTGKIGSLAKPFFGQSTAEKKRIILIVSSLGAALFLFLIIAIVTVKSRAPEKSPYVEQNEQSGRQLLSAQMASMPVKSTQAIPDDELFPPAEPDFLPDFLLEREPGKRWSVEDIDPYWKNPAAGPALTASQTGRGGAGEERVEWFRAEVKTAVDKLMDGVP